MYMDNKLIFVLFT